MPDSPNANTTAPGLPETGEALSPLPSFGLVILALTSERGRQGETGFLRPFEWLYIGRGDVEEEKFVLFGRHRPGERHAPKAPHGFLTGDSLSRRQARARGTAVGIEIQKTGKCVTFVNGNLVTGEEREPIILLPGHTVLFHKEALLLCVRRQKDLPIPAGGHLLHPFGEADSAGIVGESEAAWEMRAQLVAAALGGEHVLIQGESGTGKELAARLIHQRSARSGGPFVPKNAASFTLSLLESELFGNPANYPNPGMPARPGLLPSAHGGTVFLDEIGDCPPEAQALMLRALQNGECTAVGESIPRKLDLRFLGATNFGDSPFRADFRARFLRTVRLPPLRERPEDIPLLARDWLRKRAAAKPEEKLEERFFERDPSGTLEPRVSLRLLDHLVRQPLPLNMREVEAFLLRALDASVGKNEVKMPKTENGKPDNTTAPPPPPASGAEQTQRRASDGKPSKEEVLAALEWAEWNISRATRRLGMSNRNALIRLMEKYGISRDETTP